MGNAAKEIQPCSSSVAVLRPARLRRPLWPTYPAAPYLYVFFKVYPPHNEYFDLTWLAPSPGCLLAPYLFQGRGAWVLDLGSARCIADIHPSALKLKLLLLKRFMEAIGLELKN